MASSNSRYWEGKVAPTLLPERLRLPMAALAAWVVLMGARAVAGFEADLEVLGTMLALLAAVAVTVRPPVRRHLIGGMTLLMLFLAPFLMTFVTGAILGPMRAGGVDDAISIPVATFPTACLLAPAASSCWRHGTRGGNTDKRSWFR